GGDRRARLAQRGRSHRGGEALDRPCRDRLRHAGAARRARLRARLQPPGARRQRPLGHRADLGEPRGRDPRRDARIHRCRDCFESCQEAREPEESVPNAYKLVAVAVFAIYFTLPLIALSALPVKMIDGELTTLLALPPEDGGYQNDPVLGLVQNLGLTGGVLRVLEIYVGILAATILFIATNAGVIGASRVTYSMASYRQIPEVFRRLHPTFKTPVLSLVIFAGILPILIILPGDVTFVATLY